MTSASILDVIIDKFGHGQKSDLIVLFKIDTCTKIGFYDTVLSFGLAIGLKIECGR